MGTDVSFHFRNEGFFRYVKPLDELVHYGKYDPAKTRTEEEIRDYILTHIRPKLKFKI